MREDTIMRGHLFVLHSTKASSRPQTYTCIRRFMQARNLSSASCVPNPSATEPTFWLMRASTCTRSPMCVQSARDATISHHLLPPSEDTPEDCLQTCFFPTRSFLDVLQINMSCYVHCHSITLFKTYFITLQLYFPFIVSSIKIYI